MTNFITRLATTAVALPLTLGGMAPQAQAFSNMYQVGPAHNQLIDAVRSTGIQFIVNGSKCETDGGGFAGYYWAAKNEMVICQDNRNGSRHQHEVRWTANDLDTLRHEAQHLVQDCMAGHYRDGRLGAVYQDPISLAKQVLGYSNIRSILEAYSDESQHTQVMELEAFSVAALNDPLEQVRDIKKFCF